MFCVMQVSLAQVQSSKCDNWIWYFVVVLLEEKAK